MHVTELVIIAIYMVGCIGLGLYTRKNAAKSTSREFLTAGESVGSWINGMAIFAAFATGGTMLGNMGLSYNMGWGYIMTMNMGVGIGFLMVAFFIAKPFRNLRIATVPEFLKIRYDSPILRILVPIILIISITAYVVAQMKVAGMLGETLLGIPYMWGVISIGVVYVFYTAIGGMWAVTLTDFFQGSLMLFIAVVAGLIAVSFGGGVTTVYADAQALKAVWTQTQVLPLSSYIGAALVWATCLCVLPHTIMRIFSSKDELTGRKAIGIGLSFYVLTCILTLIFVAGAAVIINQGGKLANNDAAFITVIESLFPAWLKGVTYAAIFAAVMSSVSAMLLSIGAAVSYDLLKSLKPNTPDDFIKKLNTICVIVFGFVAIAFSMKPPEFMTLLYSAAVGFLASGLFWPTMLGLWWKRMNKYGALAGFVGGAGVYLYCMFGMSLPSLTQINYSMPVALVLSVVVSLLTPPPSKKELARLEIAHVRQYEIGELGDLEIK